MPILPIKCMISMDINYLQVPNPTLLAKSYSCDEGPFLRGLKIQAHLTDCGVISAKDLASCGMAQG